MPVNHAPLSGPASAEFWQWAKQGGKRRRTGGGGLALQLAGPKGEQRARDKAKIKYANDWKRLVDLNRATIVCPDAAALYARRREGGLAGIAGGQAGHRGPRLTQ